MLLPRKGFILVFFCWYPLIHVASFASHNDKINKIDSSLMATTTTTTTSSSAWPNNRQPLKGIIPPLVTPLLDPQTIDREGTRRVIEHVLQGGITGIFLLGTTGEGPSLSYANRKEFIQLCSSIVQGRVPILVGITDPSFTETIQMVDCAKQAGATAIVLTAPFYFPISQPELLNYVRTVLESIGDMPLMLYNMPGLTKVWFELETLKELAKEQNIVGIKDSSGDLEYFAQLCELRRQLRPDWTILMGPEHLTAKAIQLGADGGVNGGANVEPELFVELCQAAIQGDAERVGKLQERIDAFQAIYRVGQGFRFVVATKCAMSVRKLCSDVMALPFTSFSPSEQQQIRNVLDNLPSVVLRPR